MRLFLGSAVITLICGLSLPGQEKPAAQPQAMPDRSALISVKRIYVAELSGGEAAQALRELLIASLDSLKLFTLTDNPDRADAVLRGAADDKAFTDSYDSAEGVNGRESGGKYGSGGSFSKGGGAYLGMSAGGNEAHHIKERKHEAYATVRLCGKDGDVLWSTTQESQGAKFRSASADVAAKVAHQLGADIGTARRPSADTTGAGIVQVKP